MVEQGRQKSIEDIEVDTVTGIEVASVAVAVIAACIEVVGPEVVPKEQHSCCSQEFQDKLGKDKDCLVERRKQASDAHYCLTRELGEAQMLEEEEGRRWRLLLSTK